MKAVPLALLFSLSLTVAAADVRLGDTLSDVRATLGVPRGQLRVGNRHLLYYDRGEIELQAGAVTRVVLLSVEDQAALEARRAAEATRAREEQEIYRARLSAEGEVLKARKLAEPSFRAAPLAYQVAFWEDFSRRYPDVPNTEQLSIARFRLAEQLEQRRAQAGQAERLAELEARVSDAGARDSEAESDFQGVSNSPSYSHGRSYARHRFNRSPVQFPLNFTGLPFLTPPNAPYSRVTDRHDRGRGWSDNNLGFNRRDSHVHNHSFDFGLRPFVGRNRL